jgi:hypothetical protein
MEYSTANQRANQSYHAESFLFQNPLTGSRKGMHNFDMQAILKPSKHFSNATIVLPKNKYSG